MSGPFPITGSAVLGPIAQRDGAVAVDARPGRRSLLYDSVLVLVRAGYVTSVEERTHVAEALQIGNGLDVGHTDEVRHRKLVAPGDL
jgi:hypothetical protein